MPDFPKSVRGRLAQTPPLEHPEADALNAYSEGVLGAAERERMVAHLAICRRCREVVSLAAPPLEALQASQPALRRVPSFQRSGQPETGNRKLETRPWFRFPVLRWGVAMAAATIVISAVLLHRPADLVRPVPSPIRTETPPSAPPVYPDTAKPGTLGTLPQKAEETGPAGLTEQGAQRPGDRDKLSMEVAQPARKPSEKVTQPAAEAAETTARSYPRKSPVISNSNIDRTHGPAAPSQQMLNSWQYNQNSVLQDQLAKSAPASVASASAPLSRAVAANNKDKDKDQEQDKVQDRAAGAATAQPARSDAAAAKGNGPQLADAKPATENRDLRVENGAGKSEPGFHNAYVRSGSPISGSIRWTISEDGDLVRDEGAGKQVVSMGGVTFRAVATVGADVWAGSKGGRLYHSSDGGKTWKQAAFPSAQDIVTIAFTNARNGTVKTSSGELYITSDGGQTWRRQSD